ncbi:deoxyguanosinetriphosphate triphosphohydrolase [Paractinoplanes rhizophilus]|jgi:dGTPase|uniref:Deoxyguanosinetriphosphate triphosphohydrolase-like protein n=1 Tax=Paractinoplanes rhizophilus TaxID=1416877 RepID=A0ABW2I1N5_9ACTN|nr:deoxyguanosinetriphosphate triphosphohydrolase [Actinoplanes sp.]
MTAVDAQRWVPEPAKDSGYGRTPYQRDRARVLHSAGFRRLAAKTQVHTAGSDDFLRTRLTHSLEVAQISREMGARLGCDPDVVDVAGLAHDLGHPPFGHNGETALDRAAQACGGFEGNAQTLRVLTRLEAKVPGAGLNLTRASLDACSKYPWPRKDGYRKFGVYPDDRPIFDWMRGLPGGLGERRCLEAQVMDWADDVAYSVHDVEDGVHGGYLSLRPLLDDPAERAELCADVAATYSDEPADALAAALDQLLADPAVSSVAGYDGTYGAQVTLKRMTSVLTGRFVASAVGATQSRYGTGPVRRYDADLIVPRTVRNQCALLKGMALRYVMRSRAAEDWYEQQRTILVELVDALMRTPSGLDVVFRPLFEAAESDAAALRVVVDQVASLTDHAAVAWHRTLVAART